VAGNAERANELAAANVAKAAIRLIRICMRVCFRKKCGENVVKNKM